MCGARALWRTWFGSYGTLHLLSPLPLDPLDGGLHVASSVVGDIVNPLDSSAVLRPLNSRVVARTFSTIREVVETSEAIRVVGKPSFWWMLGGFLIV